MRLNFSTGGLYTFPLKWAFEKIADAGFDGIELALWFEAILRGPAPVRQLAENQHLSVFSIHPPLFTMPGWNEVSQVRKIIDFAAVVGATVVVHHTPRASTLGHGEGAAWQRITQEARRLGEDRGVILALENIAVFRDDQRKSVLIDPEKLYRYAEEHDFLLTLDTAHAETWPWDVIEIYELFRDRLVNIHLSDFKALPDWLDRPELHSYIKHHQLPGNGYLPIPELLSCICRDRYTGYVTLELSPVALEAWWLPRLRRNLASTVAYCRNGYTSLMREHTRVGVGDASD